MFEFLTLIVFIWLLVRGIGLALRLTWGAAKIIASILMILALPALVICLLFLGGIMLLLPLIIIGTAVVVLSACT